MLMGRPQRVLAALAASLVALTAAFIAQAGAEASSSLSQVESAQATLTSARSPADFRRAFADMGVPIDQAQQLRAARAADLAAVQQEADRLVQVAAGNVDAIRAVGLQALADGRNYDTAKAYL